MKDNSWVTALRIMVRVSGWIAFPVIIALYFGRWLDNRFGTAPWLLLITIGFAFIISIYGLTVSSLKEIKRIEQEAENKKKDFNLKKK